jgi:hypothetical protein
MLTMKQAENLQKLTGKRINKGCKECGSTEAFADGRCAGTCTPIFICTVCGACGFESGKICNCAELAEEDEIIMKGIRAGAVRVH